MNLEKIYQPIADDLKIEALGFSSHKEVINLIDKAFATNDESWVSSALIAMGRTSDRRWNQRIIKMLNHQSPAIRFEATRAAGELEISDAKPILLELLEDADWDVRMAAVWALSKIGGAGLQMTFENLLQEAEIDEEIEIIETALDDLIFNQSIGLYDYSYDENDLAQFKESNYEE